MNHTPPFVSRMSAPWHRLLTAALPLLVPVLWAGANPPCPSDLDANGVVDVGDIGMVLLDFGSCPVDPPSITSVTPGYGPTGGGTTITITGSALTDTSSVTVRGNAATSVTVVNDTTVTAVTPPGSLGAANVQVATPGGTATISGAFSYSNAPPAWCTVVEQLPNAAVVHNESLRAAIVATNLPWRVLDKGTGIEMVLIPPGTFIMGCSASNAYSCNSEEVPTHQVTLTTPFYMSRTEVTQAQWLLKMGTNPSHFTGDTSCPVERVGWNDVQPFCTNNGLRLPTEAEWEFAYRAGTTTAFHSMPGYLNGTNDDNQLGNIAWFGGNSAGQTRPVGSKAANGFGLYDMSGNVWEWCQDRFGAYTSGAQTNPTGPSGSSNRVLRGGYWYFNYDFCRASFRLGNSPDTRSPDVGFRVARTP